MEAALHFRLGDIVYGLSEPRGKVVNTIKLVNDFSKRYFNTEYVNKCCMGL